MNKFFQLVTACHDDEVFNHLMSEFVKEDDLDMVLVDGVAAFRAVCDNIAESQGINSDEFIQRYGLVLAGGAI